MIRSSGSVKELENQKAIVVRVADEVLKAAGMKKLKYMVAHDAKSRGAAWTATSFRPNLSLEPNDSHADQMGLSRDIYEVLQTLRRPQNLKG